MEAPHAVWAPPFCEASPSRWCEALLATTQAKCRCRTAMSDGAPISALATVHESGWHRAPAGGGSGGSGGSGG
eukprot:CAMPEP_0206178962 /NCGR_PEP_ID=MMETSP1474-20131121/65998_1 /ASSEMBLY_ACC=CAM_ASM_001110 /TAXON_ID=97495 /ORGANISM="Imantonia sp., Strain RCC918" /LENGTH=72 /DNA_ID=CAMNT_0053591875 /DNA_START=42 /DNA_END=256 /DNA_ORIENTATION=-